MSLINHAWNEFIAAGWCNEAKDFNDEMQEDICMHVLKLLKVFSGEGPPPLGLHLMRLTCFLRWLILSPSHL
jgi:hypothetical protein